MNGEKNKILIPENNLITLTSRDKGFLDRVYKDGLEKYQKRIYQIGFKDKKHILDAGCGFGQWSFAMAQNSEKITGIDVSLSRIKICKEIAKINNFSNIEFFNESVEDLSYEDNSFDAIFCYSVIYSTDYKKTFKEFFRILKKSGNLYFVSNGWGWLIYNLIKNPYPSNDFKPRRYALETAFNSMVFKITGNYLSKKDFYVNPKKMKLFLENIGFKKVLLGPEGKLKHWDIKEEAINLSFHPDKYFGLTIFFEILAEK
ncbi:MAG: methyltransferase domain-containing protein [Candidatus Nealsonbacteria bacterium]